MKRYFAALFAVPVFAAEVPDFTREVRPILSRYCFKCHGPDDKTLKGELRLDIQEHVLRPAESGERAIVPGKPDESELVKRIFTDENEDLMPPPSAKIPMTPQQKDILRRWVEGGAEYKQHWSFVRPANVKPEGPGNPIDSFISAKLREVGLKPSPAASAATLARRIYLDLIGLPPTPAEVADFEKSASVDRQSAVSALADRLMAKPAYGERWARKWLDLARYADTNGYEKDRDRSIWPYRDWVINALNADMPYDQFTIEQIAGDMLPNATLDQKIATGFHRNTMLNEEGGIDPLEFRFHAMVDRVATTGTVWLGLTVGCAQCHTHKYDPILHTEYFQMMAFLNNTEEPELEIPAPDSDAKLKENAEKMKKLIAELPGKWPVPAPGGAKWETPKPLVAVSQNEPFRVLEDGSVKFEAPGMPKQEITISVESSGPVDRVKIEALADSKVGRVSHGNFVLSDVVVSLVSADGKKSPIRIGKAEADVQQSGFPVTDAIDGKNATGWAVDDQKTPLSKPRSGIFYLDTPVEKSAKFEIRLVQAYGNHHTMMRPKISLGAPSKGAPLVDRSQLVDAAFQNWLTKERATNVVWKPARPAVAKSNLPLLTVQPDASVYASGDISKHDTYELVFRDIPDGTTAIRLEAIDDERLPDHGPGMTYYEGRKGDFFMSEFQIEAGGAPVKIVDASHSYSKNNFGSNPASAKAATDGDLQTGWSCADRPGETHEAVFILEKPLSGAKEVRIKMDFGRHYACSLGRFRISTASAAAPVAASIPASIRELLSIPDAKLSAEQRSELKTHFLLNAPELAETAKKIRSLRKVQPAATTLVMRERPPENPRPTFLHNRGEFLQPTEKVEPGVLSVLNPMPPGKRDRLAFARWLVSPENPLTARVTVNRAWSSFFGRGIVKTVDDFGLQGEAPSHPELLDFLANEFVKSGWSQKKLHRLIVTSDTYQQSSKVSAEQLKADPENKYLGRFPRTRLEAEMIRDGTLRASGLLVEKVGGPSVRPPQPDGVTEVAYGAPKWNASTGDARYRRSLYTYAKRTAPFALYNTFDAPTGEACIARRDVSNTPLQALTILNDVMFAEASTALGKELAAQKGTVAERIDALIPRVLARRPQPEEIAMLKKFFESQKKRFEAGELDAKKFGAGTAEAGAWAALVRSLFNLDEVLTKS
jgi:hypothetical protein